MSIKVEHLSRRFGAFAAVDDVSFDIPGGELVAFLGPSGSGKSTILRIVAGLEQADTGAVYFDGRRADHLHARDRGVGFVFQHYALFKHMTIARNIAFGLHVRGVPGPKQTARVKYLLKLMGLEGLDDRYPSQLSGGQRQRVALARALAPEPKVLLLDEPFGAVDAKVREELRSWLRRLHDEVHVTSIFVTHDQEEAFAVADRVMVLHRGRLEQAGSPTEIIDHPATEFVARFVGEANVFDSVARDGFAAVGALRVPVDGFPDGTPLRLVMRAYDLKFWLEEAGPATVTRVTPLGDRGKVEAVIDGGIPIFAQFPRRSSLLKGLEPGRRIQIEVTVTRAYPAVRPGSPGVSAATSAA
jgi:sulfate transport system ATP-binding protein